MTGLAGSRFSNKDSSSSDADVYADVSKDVELASPPEDSISSMAWSQTADMLAVTSWDSKLRLYHVSSGAGMSGNLKATVEFQAPVLSCSWSPDGKYVVAAGTDGAARITDPGANGAPTQQIGAHDLPISSVRFFQGPGSAGPMVVTGSWDKTIKYWDLRTSVSVATVDCKEKVYSMDIAKKMFVVATAERGFRVIDLDNPTKIYLQPEISQLKKENRVVRCFPNGQGFVAGTLEGKCAIHPLPPLPMASNSQVFSFKCHRDPTVKNITQCHVVNTIAFHPAGVFCTGGSNGTISIWDKEAKIRTQAFPQLGGPISSTAFNGDGKFLAYAVCYDWNKGYAYNTPQHVNKIMIHPVCHDDIKRTLLPNLGPTKR